MNKEIFLEMNVGEYCFDNAALFKALESVTNNNAQNEYYITDVIEIMNHQNLNVGGYKIDDLSEVGGINDKFELQEATKQFNIVLIKTSIRWCKYCRYDKYLYW